MENRTRNSLFILIAIITGFLFFYYRGNVLNEKIRKNHIVVCGTVLNLRYGKGLNVVYQFYYNNKRFEFNETCPPKISEDFKNSVSKILIVLENKNPNNNVILSDEDDYKKFEIIDKDTLKIRCK
jgi:hypothetical protein